MDSSETKRIASEVEAAYAEHGKAVFSFSLRLCGNWEDAEDVTVQTFAHAFSSWDRFKGEGSRRAWLFGIAANRARMSRRQTRKVEALSEDVPYNSQHPVEMIALEREVLNLPIKQREAFLLVKGEGVTAREAAQTLGRPLGTVLYEVHQAVRALRRALGDGLSPATLLESDL